LAHHVGPGLVVHDALVLEYVAIDDQTAQVSGTHAWVGHEGLQEACIGPAEPRLGFLGCDRVPCVRLQRGKNLQLRHEAGIQADKIELVQAAALADSP